jgi:hypothetical protein
LRKPITQFRPGRQLGGAMARAPKRHADYCYADQ